jgi:hypothetical protein
MLLPQVFNCNWRHFYWDYIIHSAVLPPCALFMKWPSYYTNIWTISGTETQCSCLETKKYRILLKNLTPKGWGISSWNYYRSKESTIFWTETPCSLVDVCRCFKETNCLHLQGQYVWMNINMQQVMNERAVFVSVCRVYSVSNIIILTWICKV